LRSVPVALIVIVIVMTSLFFGTHILTLNA